MALIELARATELIPNFPSADNGVMGDLINAASDTVVRYCNRDFALTIYDELLDGPGANNLLTTQYPITQVLRISKNPSNVLGITMQDTATSRASWRLDGTTDAPPKPKNLYLLSYKNGVETSITIGPLTSATPTVTINGGSPTSIAPILTLNNLATVINTYGAAYQWNATALGTYGTWNVSDIRPPQGALESRWFGFSYVTLHGMNLFTFDYNPDVGEIVSPQGFSRGYRNYRVIYQAGYSTIPYPIQQAVAALAVSVYQSRGLNPNLTSESLGGYSYTQATDRTFAQLDFASSYGLALFRNHRVSKFRV